MPAEDSIELEVSEECTMIEEIEKSEIIEEKVNSRRHSDQEIVSQTITSSIYQFNKSNLTLVPSLLLTPSSFSILCYDPVNDVLLRSRQVHCGILRMHMNLTCQQFLKFGWWLIMQYSNQVSMKII